MRMFYKLANSIPALVDDPVATRWSPSVSGFTFTTPSAVRNEGVPISEEEYDALVAKLEAEATEKQIEPGDK